MSWTKQEWIPPDDARRTRDRWGGTYWAYEPFSLTRAKWSPDPVVSKEAARVERRIRNLTFDASAGKLEALSRYLLRSEAVSSSYMEGVQSNARKIALEELKRVDSPTKTGHTPVAISPEAEVVGNIEALTDAVEHLSNIDLISWQDIENLQGTLLPSQTTLGTRDRQNWVGGSELHPGEAEFIPPTADALQPAIADLIDFLNGSANGPLIQAGIVHAQFETLHPFGDGNGRIGRALIHTVLARTGLARASILPISQVLLTRSEEYVTGLMAFRGIPNGADLTADREPKRSLSISEGVNAWLSQFVSAADAAVDLAFTLKEELRQFEENCHQLVKDHARQTGSGIPRSHSTVWKVIDILPKLPALTINAAAQLTETTRPSAKRALEFLEAAGVLDEQSVRKGQRGYVCRDLINLLNSTQRKRASTRFDTRISKPNRPAPGRSVK